MMNLLSMVTGNPQNEMLPTGVYRHYKGGLYRVHTVAYFEATLEPVVVYESLTDSELVPKGTFWVRPLSEFTEELPKKAKERVKRFTYETAYDHWVL